jgi:glycosyltransferase involved in cell wall biosynthesis
LVIYNLQNVFNHFVKWLRRQPRRPLIVLRIGDSGGLGEKISLSRRLRYKFKPMQMLEAQSVLMYDACLVSSLSSRRYFEPRGVPWMWHPTTYRFEYDPPPSPPNQNGPIRFGYFGTLSNSSATLLMVQAFLKADVQGTLHICGHGPLAEELKSLTQRHPNIHFDGFLPKESDCLDWAQKVDVLINPRPPIKGQDNSFPSKVLEYGIAGRAILSSFTAGVDEALGKEGLYFDAENFEESLPKKIREVSAMDRAELQRRAQVIRTRVVKEFSAGEQARRIMEFLEGILLSRPSGNGRQLAATRAGFKQKPSDGAA